MLNLESELLHQVVNDVFQEELSGTHAVVQAPPRAVRFSTVQVSKMATVPILKQKLRAVEIQHLTESVPRLSVTCRYSILDKFRFQTIFSRFYLVVGLLSV